MTFQELEAEKEKSAAQEKELQELRIQLERHNRVSKLLMEEVTGLKNNADKDREMAETWVTLLIGVALEFMVSWQPGLLMVSLKDQQGICLVFGEILIPLALRVSKGSVDWVPSDDLCAIMFKMS